MKLIPIMGFPLLLFLLLFFPWHDGWENTDRKKSGLMSLVFSLSLSPPPQDANFRLSGEKETIAQTIFNKRFSLGGETWDLFFDGCLPVKSLSP